MLHIDSLWIITLLLLLFQITTRVIYQRLPEVLGFATNIHLQQLLVETNKKRVEVGLNPLVLNERLSQAALAKAADMFAKNYWAHNGPDGKVPWDFIVASGYDYSIAGENLAKNFLDSNGVVEAWMASQTHRANIVKPGYKDIGFAIVNGKLLGEETTLVVQMFGAAGDGGASEVTLVPTAPPQPVEVTSVAAEIQKEEPQISVLPSTLDENSGVAGVFAAVAKNPLFSFPLVRRDVLLVFLGSMMGILIVDAWLIARRRVVRVSGRSLAHIMFFGSLVLMLARSWPGSIV